MTALPGDHPPRGGNRATLLQRLEGYDQISDLVAGSDTDVLKRLDGKPALLTVPGDTRDRARAVACLLHGNEDSGFRAVLRLLRERRSFPFDLVVFIGNTRAATQNGWFADRFLDDQEDFNRVWGIEPVTTRMRRCAAQVLDTFRRLPLEGLIDLHNNTGRNPFYAILPRSTLDTFALAATCADIGLLWGAQAHTLMQAVADTCPAVAVECGLPGDDAHTEYAVGVLERFLAAEHFEGAAGGARPAQLFEIVYRVEVRPEVPFAFDHELTDDIDLCIRPGLDRQNFGMLLAATEIGRVDPSAEVPLLVTGRHELDDPQRFFTVTRDGRLLTTEDITPVMMTTSVQQTRRDCLFYIARRRA